MQHMMRRFLRDEGGSVFIFVGLAIVVLIGVIGIALDLGTQGMLKTRMQNAADSAALGGAVADGVSNVEREAIARRYFALNYPDNYQGTDLTAANVGITASGDSVLVDTNNRTRRADLIPVVGIENIQTRAVSEVANTTSGAAQLRDITLVMDASGSMSEQINEVAGTGGVRIVEARTAAQIIVDEVLCNASTPGSRVGWVEYAARCTSPFSCDSSPSQFLALSGSCSAVTAKVNSYTYRNAWGPGFSEGWTNGADGVGIAENIMSAARPNVVRAVIYMTDGLNNTAGSRNWCFDPAEAASCHGVYHDGSIYADAPALDACNRLKANGVIVYGVAFSANAQDAQVIRDCASGPDYYFYAPDAVALQDAFRSIFTSIKKIRITR